MTIKDAIFVLNCVEAHGICIEAKKMAIKSLEAWEKVKEEVEDKINSLDDELKNGEVCLSYYYGKLAGLSEVLEIIDKHSGGRAWFTQYVNVNMAEEIPPQNFI